MSTTRGLEENASGSCFGSETCEGADGWSDCTARTPAAEFCDGVDNDCNGVTDGGFLNTDGDALADCVDLDIDNDGSLNPADCCDTDANTRTSQAAWFTGADNCGSFDYDCSSSSEQEQPSTGECYCDSYFLFFCTGCASANGWVDSVPACGASGSYISSCSQGTFDCTAGTATQVQACH
jgi:hypothetical protein